MKKLIPSFALIALLFAGCSSPAPQPNDVLQETTQPTSRATKASIQVLPPADETTRTSDVTATDE